MKAAWNLLEKHQQRFEANKRARQGGWKQAGAGAMLAPAHQQLGQPLERERRLLKFVEHFQQGGLLRREAIERADLLLERVEDQGQPRRERGPQHEPGALAKAALSARAMAVVVAADVGKVVG